jgi:hypothetical protein
MFKEWRYRLEKGRPHLIMLVGLLLVIVGVIVLGGLIVYASGIGETLRESLWWTFLHVSDPGYLGDDDTPVTAVFGTLFTILGMITFVAGLIGILTSLITSLLISLREGGAPIAFSDHIVIFGWNSRVFTLLADLLHADGEHRIALTRLRQRSASKPGSLTRSTGARARRWRTGLAAGWFTDRVVPR